MSALKELFSGDFFMPHGHCYLWKPEIVWLHVVSDTVIVLAYYSIPITLTYVVYKTKGTIPFNWILLLFALFIMACGTTHLMEIVNVWETRYVLAGLIKAFTAVISILTAVAILPKILDVLNQTQDKPE